MKFLNPTTDIVFKKLFGTVKNKHILISFLNSILEKKEDHKIIDVVFLDTFNKPNDELNKLSIVDVRCQDQDGAQYIVEVQVRKQQDFSLRAQYYVGCAMANQLEAGQTYNKILPVIFIGVIDFELFRTPTCLSHHLVLNKDSHEHAIKEIEFHFIELPKFKKTIEQLETETDKWIFFLDKAEDFSMVPSELKNPIAVKDALNVLDRGTWSKEDLMQYEKALDDERVVQSVLRTAQEDGRAEGRAEGRTEGRTEGRAEGRAEGEKIGMEKEKFEVAKKMISKGLSIDTICEITGLNHEEVKALVPSKFGQT